jgi:hypothetical protein
VVVAEALRIPILFDRSAHDRAFLRCFGTMCSIASVRRIDSQSEGNTLDLWLQLDDDDEAGQDAVYEAFRRYQSAKGVPIGGMELHVIFADEDTSAFPANAETLFVRE